MVKVMMLREAAKQPAPDIVQEAEGEERMTSRGRGADAEKKEGADDVLET